MRRDMRRDWKKGRFCLTERLTFPFWWYDFPSGVCAAPLRARLSRSDFNTTPNFNAAVRRAPRHDKTMSRENPNTTPGWC